jgi:hypothetical protein
MARARVFQNLADLPAGGAAYLAHVLEDGGIHCWHGGAWHPVGGEGSGPVAWNDVTGKPATFPPDAHNHDASYSAAGHNHDTRYYTEAEVDTALATKAATGHNHAGVYEPANANIQTHIAAAHAPANAQKNSDITKAEIEAKLTGEIASHTHAAGAGFSWTAVAVLAGDVSTAANTTPVTVTGLVFTFAANSTYAVEVFGLYTAAAATTGIGLQWDTSAAVTQIAFSFVHQLANTGTLSGGSSVADDASIGVSSGMPANSQLVPVIASGFIKTGANTGTAQLRLRSETTAVATLKAGTCLRVHKIA